MAEKAPGKHYRKSMSPAKIFKMFPDSQTAEAWFAENRWEGRPVCPYCGSVNVQTNCHHNTMPYRCREKACGKKFSVRAGTVMEGSKLDYQKWAIATYLFLTNLKGVSAMKLHRDLGITQKAAWHLAHRLREGLVPGGGLFSGPVEVDETYIGGKRKNMSNAARRKALKDTGRGAVGIKDRETNEVKAKVVDSTDAKTLQPFIKESAEKQAGIYTDGATSYDGLPFDHESVNHSVSEYVNGIESFWALLKRGYHGTYHHLSEKHLNRYVNEFAGRHNIRSNDTIDPMESLARNMQGKRLAHEDLTA